MAKEIERKFLIDRDHPDVIALLGTIPVNIRQGYIMSGPAGVVRVRITDDQAFLTIKGVSKGISRDEFEYPIPKGDAEQMLSTMCGAIIEKQRFHHTLPDNHIVELDVFLGIDLIIAEVELTSETASFAKPSWFAKDVSTDPAYYNNNIAARLQASVET